MKILFYDMKPYDKESFEKVRPLYGGIEIDYLKTDIKSFGTSPENLAELMYISGL